MNRISLYKVLPLTLICGSISTVQAQSAAKDTTYSRQISVERDFSPTLQDANKINTLPSLYDPAVKKSNAPLASWSTAGNPKPLELANTDAGNFGTDIEHDHYKGYAGLRIGSHGNIEAEAGYQAISNETTKLDIFGTYNSSSGEPMQMDYLQDNLSKAKSGDALLKVRFQHKFEPLTLYINSHFSNDSYNYYGTMYNYNGESSDNSGYDWDKKQSANIFNLTAGVKSKDETILRYKVFASYDNFGLKYGYEANKGPKANILTGDFNFNTDFGSDKVIGINAHILNQSLSEQYKDLHSLTHFKFNPYINFTGSNWNATLGINGHLTFDTQNKVLWAPNLAASWNFLETTSLYASVIGDVNENTLIDILQENRYYNPSSRISSSRTYYDAEIGIKSGVIKGLEFNIFTGYKYTAGEHLYYSWSGSNAWENLNEVIYANLNVGNFGGSIETNLIPYVDLSAKLTTYFYTVKYRDADTYSYMPKSAWNKPTYVLELNADIKPIDKFVISANYQLAGGRKYYDTSTNLKGDMKSVNEMNVKGTYQITKMVSATAAINNLLNQAYELNPGYACYGINFLVGANLKF